MSHGNAHVLPDSRLKDRNFGAVMADWPLPRTLCDYCWGMPGGCVVCKGTGWQKAKTVRLECLPCYCSCGKLVLMAPKDNLTFLCVLCRKCFEKYGIPEGTFVTPDEEFCKAVSYEIQERFGRELSDLELVAEIDQGRLGTALELLARESPYPVWRGE